MAGKKKVNLKYEPEYNERFDEKELYLINREEGRRIFICIQGFLSRLLVPVSAYQEADPFDEQPLIPPATPKTEEDLYLFDSCFSLSKNLKPDDFQQPIHLFFAQVSQVPFERRNSKWAVKHSIKLIVEHTFTKNKLERLCREFDYIVMPFQHLTTRYIPFEYCDGIFIFFTSEIFSLEEIEEHKAFMILLKRYFKWFFDADFETYDAEDIIPS